MKDKYKKSERGSAIIVTLGILALVMVMAMAFAFTSRTNLHIAKLNSDTIKAKLHADSALGIILANIKQSLSFDGNNNKYDHINYNIITARAKLTNKKFGEQIFFNADENATGEFDSIDNGGIVYTDNFKAKNKFPEVFTSASSYLEALNSKITTNDLSSVKFNSIKDNNDVLVGRFAYVIVDDTPRIDVNQILTLTKSGYNMPIVEVEDDDANPRILNARISPLGTHFDNAKYSYYFNLFNEYNPDETIKLTGEGGKNNFAFNGLLMKELWPKLGLDNKYYDDLKDVIKDSKKAPWLSYGQLLDKNSDFKDTDSISYYTFYSGESPESYRVDDDEIARFDISGYEWGYGEKYYKQEGTGYIPSPLCNWEACNDKTLANDTSSVSHKLAYARKLVNKLSETDKGENFWKDGGIKDTHSKDDVKAVKYFYSGSDFDFVLDANYEDDFKGIPWLKGNKQIAANMVDFCDSDDNATYPKKDSGDEYDFDSFAQPEDMPDYFGNEKVPYFTKLAIGLEPLCHPSTDGTQYEYNCHINIGVIWVNPFIDAVTENRSCKGIIVLYYRFNGEPFKKKTVNFTIPAPGTVPSKGYISQTIKVEKFMESKIMPPIAPTSPDTSVVEFVRIAKVILYTGSTAEGFGDLAVWKKHKEDTDDSSQYEDRSIEIMDTTGNVEWITEVDSPEGYFALLEARDPEFNYGKESVCDLWRWTDNLGKNYEYFEDLNFNSKVETKKNISSCLYYEDSKGGIDYDYRNSSDLDIGYSYVKNSPFEGFDELGLVHRGEIGCTLNLLKYNDSGTIGSYTEGDANILDQVKVGPLKFRKGLLSPLMLSSGAGKALFKTISGVEPDSIPNDTIEHLNKAKSALRTIIPLSCIKDSDFKNVDSEGNVANTISLMSSRYQSFTILIVAQSLKQIGKNVPSDEVHDLATFNLVRSTLAAPVVYNDDGNKFYCDVLGSHSRMVHVLYDNWARSIKIVGVENLK